MCDSDYSGASVIYLVTIGKLHNWQTLQRYKSQFQTLLEGSQTCIHPPYLCKKHPDHRTAADVNINVTSTVVGIYVGV